MVFRMYSSKLFALALWLIVLSACSKQEQAAAPTSSANSAAVAAPAAADPSKTGIATMDAGQLRAAANKALADNRIYVPEGDNALEYYLAARDKQPNDPAVTSALTDLLPYVIIATEQSIAREDFAKAQRLSSLIERTDANAPALPRLKQSLANAQLAASKRTAEETAKVQQQILARQLEEQRQAQQRIEQQRTADLLQQQQEAARARQAAAAAPPPVEPAVTQPAPVQAVPLPQPTAAPAPIVLRPISTPDPHYPAAAARAGTSGEVVVQFTVNTDGSVTNPRVLRSTPARVFDRDALSAVARWKFAPIAEPVTTQRTIAFNFTSN
jgi:protein TonB